MNVVRGSWRSCCRFFKEMEAVAMTVEKLSEKFALLRLLLVAKLGAMVAEFKAEEVKRILEVWRRVQMGLKRFPETGEQSGSTDAPPRQKN